jgi:putative ABC transport system substrate-binding protein
MTLALVVTSDSLIASGSRCSVKRREFITLLGGIATAWPLTARAQQPEGMRRVGVLTSLTADAPLFQGRIDAFLQELQ